MKKRSLFTAVVMLVVSAVVLTSSTYAWFQASQKSYVEKVSAGITASDVGNVLVRAGTSGNNWGTHLAPGDLVSGGSATLQAVDFDPIASKTAEVFANFDGLNYEVTANTGNSAVLFYEWTVKALSVPTTGSWDIAIPLTFNAGGAKPAIHGAITVDGGAVTKIYGSNSYTPLIMASGSNKKGLATDDASKTAGIIETDEIKNADVSLKGSTVGNGGVTDTIYIENVTSNTVYTIGVYVWCEGQDSNCTNSVSISGAGFEFGDGSTSYISLVEHQGS